ncbi:MAG TPA: EthD family reductase [Caldilineaceae bacterium]|nr:EthD family reductase [Caldilineaceae bacterium]
MVKISILYPNRAGSRFDMDYYLNTHMPMSIERLSAHPGFKGVSVERGLAGGAPGSEPTYTAMCHFLFDSMEAFLAAFMPNAAHLQGDMPNYTDSESIIQVSEVEIMR